MNKITIQLFGTWDDHALTIMNAVLKESGLNPFDFNMRKVQLPISVTEVNKSFDWKTFFQGYFRTELHYTSGSGILIGDEDDERKITTWSIRVWQNTSRIEYSFIDVWDESDPTQRNRQMTYGVHHVFDRGGKYHPLKADESVALGWKNGKLRFAIKE
jgi:hypothetical protein